MQSKLVSILYKFEIVSFFRNKELTVERADRRSGENCKLTCAKNTGAAFGLFRRPRLCYSDRDDENQYCRIRLKKSSVIG